MKTTIACILLFTTLVFVFGIKKPDSTVVAAAKPVAAKVAAPQQAGSSEFAPDTKIAPKEEVKAEAATAEKTPAIGDMTKEQLQGEIDSLQEFAKRENAVARLNEDSVSAVERAEWGKVFERLLALRSRNLRLQLEQAQASLASYQAQHQVRVASFLGSKS